MKKKTIILTGSSRGIGLAITKKLLLDGHEVIGIARSHTFEHENYIPKKIDLSDLKFLPEHLKALGKEFPKIDGLICNAGVWHYRHFEELSFEEIRRMMDLNFLSHVFLIKTFLPQMKLQKNGDIFFIGSTSGLKGPEKESIYGASKGALRVFAQSLRSECATKNIRITTLNPGAVKTDMLDLAPFELGEDPLHHILPEDIANLISYLLKSRLGTVMDEIHLSPQKHRIQKKKVMEKFLKDKT